MTLVYADDPGAGTAHMIEQRFGYLEPDAEFLKIRCEGSPKVVECPTGDFTRFAKIPSRFRCGRHNFYRLSPNMSPC